LGAPDYGFRGDFTYLSSSIGSALGGIIVAAVFIPRYYAMHATTVYELLDVRYGRPARRAAGGMFLLGRVLAGGSRVYLGAIAVSMIMFGELGAMQILVASLILVVVSFAFTFVGGLKSIVWNDLVQFAIFSGAAVAILIYLWLLIPASTSDIVGELSASGKLRVFNFSLSPSEPFSMPAILIGITLLATGNFGLDQDTTQRLLASKDAREGSRSLYTSVLMSLPITVVFIAIGQLLYVFYSSPQLMQRSGVSLAETFHGQQITVFMHFILTHIPPGLRGLATIGIIAAAVATTNSAMNAMSSVLISDFYRPWREKRRAASEAHFVHAGRFGMAFVGLLMFAVSVLSFFWQRYTNLPILEFVLAAQTFAYSGLLGVYFTAVFTRRGSNTSVIASLLAGFLTILLLQKYSIDTLGLPAALKSLAFPWQLCVGTLVAFVTCCAGAKGTHVND
jgi:Na+/proline symporter